MKRSHPRVFHLFHPAARRPMPQIDSVDERATGESPARWCAVSAYVHAPTPSARLGEARGRAARQVRISLPRWNALASHDSALGKLWPS